MTLFADTQKPIKAGNIVISMFVAVVAVGGIVAAILFKIKKQKHTKTDTSVQMADA